MIIQQEWLYIHLQEMVHPHFIKIYLQVIIQAVVFLDTIIKIIVQALLIQILN